MSGHSRPSFKGREVYSHILTDSKGLVQNVKAARVYVFGNDDIVEDEENENVEFEMPEIRARRGQTDLSSVFNSHTADEEQEVFYEKEICEGDTLQSLSLKYACPMSELKRINNLMKEQDFFALRILKIPMRRHGILSEIAKQEETAAAAAKPTRATFCNGTMLSDSEVPSDVCSDIDFSDPETQLRVMRTVSIRDNFSRQGREADRFLKKMDKDLQKFRETRASERESLEEVVSMLTNRSIYPLQRRQRTNGADCGIRWWVIVLIALCIAVLMPIMYLVFAYYFAKEHSVQTGSNVTEDTKFNEALVF